MRINIVRVVRFKEGKGWCLSVCTVGTLESSAIRGSVPESPHQMHTKKKMSRETHTTRTDSRGVHRGLKIGPVTDTDHEPDSVSVCVCG